MDVFVPGRLCILGEHSDWVAEYKGQNPGIPDGFTLICATNEGIHASVTAGSSPDTLRFDAFIPRAATSDIRGDPPEVPDLRSFEMKLDCSSLLSVAQAGGFFSYVAGTACAMIRRDSWWTRMKAVGKGIFINNHSTTLPMKKGLSSSAAVCVLVATAFNLFYELHLSTDELMDAAYQGEMLTPSRCGRMDQCVVMGHGAVAVMRFYGPPRADAATVPCRLQLLQCTAPLYFVVADLMSSKDTVAILSALHSCFPLPKTAREELMHKYVEDNVSISQRAAEAIAGGHAAQLGEEMMAAQRSFDSCAIPNCPIQLSAPVLHELMKDLLEVFNGEVLAVKGIGSQGDGSAQILCNSLAAQSQVLQYLTSRHRMQAFPLTIPPNTSK